MAQDSNNLIWIDLEMTGLDTTRDEIIEIATIVTKSNTVNQAWCNGFAPAL